MEAHNGLYCVICPWTVHFSGARPELALNNPVIGIASPCSGSASPWRRPGCTASAGPFAALGIWMIISPWVVSTTGPGAGAIADKWRSARHPRHV
ncbi:SPW repeat protein [Streptomyces sp. PA03-6a]|nr:SPW repeat protein [Streptomyces sp. PA03-6a]